MKEIVEEIHSILDMQEYSTLTDAKKNIPTKSSGFYWIYTRLPLIKFSEASKPTNTAHVDFSLMASNHNELNYIVKQTDLDYWCVYNGKGTDLKARISAGFTNTSGKTGKLALTRCFKEEDFRVKYIICSDSELDCGISNSYKSTQRDLERVWRLNYGWPLLCRI